MMEKLQVPNRVRTHSDFSGRKSEETRRNNEGYFRRKGAQCLVKKSMFLDAVFIPLVDIIAL